MPNPRSAALLLTAALWCCAGSSAATGAGEQEEADTPANPPGEEVGQEQELSVTLTLNRATYPASAPISMALRVENPTSDPLTLAFSDGQRFDFVVRDADGGERWRWSEGRFFTQALGSETVAAGDSLVYEATMEEGLEAGRYTVVGLVTARDRSLRDSAEVEVGDGR